MRHPHGLRAAAGSGEVLESTIIGAAANGGFFAGYISHTANGVATHALIVAPRATGATGGQGAGQEYPLNTWKTWKISGTTTAGTTNTFDGEVNMAAMVAAGIADHPAADFCFGLTIGGYDDWYLPARYELDIAFQNLKDSTGVNDTNYGINPYSVPARTVNRTTGIPAQTSALAFRTGGAEAFVPNNSSHWTSTSLLAADAFVVFMSEGQNLEVGKTTLAYTRAFRKVAL